MIIKYDVGSGDVLNVRQEYDKSANIVEFSGFVKKDTKNTVYYKIEMEKDSLPIMIPLIDFQLEIKSPITSMNGMFNSQLVEISPNEDYICNSKMFKTFVNNSIKNGKEYEIEDTSLNLIYTKINELYETIKGDLENGELVGNGIQSVVLTSSVGLVDNYTIYFTNGETTTFSITNGKEGKSSYDVAVQNGYKGTEEEWLETLRGEKGDNGASVYEIAVSNGFVGTEEDFINSLKYDHSEEFNQLAQQVRQDRESVEEKVNEFNVDYQNKVNGFNANVSNSIDSFNENALYKEIEYNGNHQQKLNDYNSNAVEKKDEYNTNATEKIDEYNSNTLVKTEQFESLVEDTKDILDEAIATTNQNVETTNQNVSITQQNVEKTEENVQKAINSMKDKVDRFQGEENNGKFLGVGEDGYVGNFDIQKGAKVEYNEEEEAIHFNGYGDKTTYDYNTQIINKPTINGVLLSGDKVLGDFDLYSKQESLEKTIETYYAMRRTGKIYKTRIPKFNSNPTSTCEKMLDNEGLVFVPSTDTVEGQDDYLNGQNPLFEWVNCNYIRDEDGTARPISIEGMKNYRESGDVDVGVMQMSFYWKWDNSNEEYIDLIISDSPNEELGLVPWVESVKANGEVLPWCIGSKYICGLGEDGLLRSQPNLKPFRKNSYNNMITNFQKKGAGYWGAGACRNTFQIIFNLIKGATKSSQNLYSGCSSYNFQYDASIARESIDTFFPLTKAQANNVVVGNYVSVGHEYLLSNGSTSRDRNYDSIHAYCDDVKVLKKEDIDENNVAIYLDIDVGFSTTPISLSETISSNIILTSMHWHSGSTNKVKGKHDGSFGSNKNGRSPYRVQGREYMCGGYVIESDSILDFQTDSSKNVYVAKKGVQHQTNDLNIRNTYKLVGNIPYFETNGEFWIGDIDIDMETSCWFPIVKGSSSAQGCGDFLYGGGKSTSDIRVRLQGGGLRNGTNAGSCYLSCWHGLGNANWNYLCAD